MLIEVSSRICFNHVPNVSRMLVKFMVKCFYIYNVVIVVFGSDLCFCILKSVQQISTCVSQWQSHSHWVRTRDCLLYKTLWECLICHYSDIYPLLPMNLSTYLSIHRQRNPLCANKILIFVWIRHVPSLGGSLLLKSVSVCVCVGCKNYRVQSGKFTVITLKEKTTNKIFLS